jgi:hypothetical protein
VTEELLLAMTAFSWSAGAFRVQLITRRSPPWMPYKKSATTGSEAECASGTAY